MASSTHPSRPGLIRSWRVLLLTALFVTSVLAAVNDDDETNYVNLLLRDLDTSGGQDQQQTDKILDSKDSVKRHWGISDATTVAGKIFSYPIPDDAFTGKIQKFEVTEAGESRLPAWLLYDEDSLTFTGVPLGEDIGQYYISVKAIGNSQSKSPFAKDVFSIEVVDDSPDSRFSDSENSGYCLVYNTQIGEVLKQMSQSENDN